MNCRPSFLSRRPFPLSTLQAQSQSFAGHEFCPVGRLPFHTEDTNHAHLHPNTERREREKERERDCKVRAFGSHFIWIIIVRGGGFCTRLSSLDQWNSGSCTKAWLLLRRPCCCSLLGLVSSPNLVWFLDGGIRCTPPRQVVFFFSAGGREWGCICISHCMPVECFNKLRTESIIGPRRPVKCLGRLGFFFLSNFGALECSLEQLGEYICAAVL